MSHTSREKRDLVNRTNEAFLLLSAAMTRAFLVLLWERARRTSARPW